MSYEPKYPKEKEERELLEIIIFVVAQLTGMAIIGFLIYIIITAMKVVAEGG